MCAGRPCRAHVRHGRWARRGYDPGFSSGVFDVAGRHITAHGPMSWEHSERQPHDAEGGGRGPDPRYRSSMRLALCARPSRWIWDGGHESRFRPSVRGQYAPATISFTFWARTRSFSTAWALSWPSRRPSRTAPGATHRDGHAGCGEHEQSRDLDGLEHPEPAGGLIVQPVRVVIPRQETGHVLRVVLAGV